MEKGSLALVFFSARIGKYDSRYGPFTGLEQNVWPNVLSVVLLSDAEMSGGHDFHVPQPSLDIHDGVIDPKYMDTIDHSGEEVMMI